jgi:2-(1,2-epoxy-1,2-dihydrophenyl)acetyl-CoA isomerase
MSYTEIEVSQKEGVVLIELNRPDKLNAYTPVMGEELVSALREAGSSSEVHAVVLTGKGDAFCAGADLEYLQGKTTAKGARLGEEEFIASFTEELAALPVLTIAAINGAAAGIGVTGTLAFDIRIAADDAKLVLNFAELGILPGLGASFFLPRLVGEARAKELLLCQRRLSGREAAAMGLVNRAVPRVELMALVEELALSAAGCQSGMIADIKRAIAHGSSATLAEALALEKQISSERRL